ncbi:MAG: citrate/2-methylcitrate synthase [Candidatus Thorarchaeota archaeon]
MFLLVNGRTPTTRQRNKLAQRMKHLRNFYTEEIESLDSLIDRLAEYREKLNLNLHDTLLTYVTMSPLVIANQFAKLQNQEYREFNPELDHIANFLWMIKGNQINESDLTDFQTALILPMDDPDNPSLTALVHALEKGDEIDALRAALKEHVGPLHHGAGTLAMKMFEEIRKPERAQEYLDERLNLGAKIFGLGHRIYRGIDPRAVVLKEILARRAMNSSDEWLVHISEAVAREGKTLLAMKKGIDAFPNIDLYNAAVYHTFGFPSEFNTPLFAVSRAAGWMAHILELKSQSIDS